MTSKIENFFPSVLGKYHLDPKGFTFSRLGSGHIHDTFKLDGVKSYILQRVNKNVFKQPEVIASNIQTAASYLKKNFPDFLFLTPITASDGKQMVYDEEGFPWRLFPFFENTITIDKVSTADEAKSAAAEFGRLTKYLSGADPALFKETIPRFHDLMWRDEQFQNALAQATPDRLEKAKDAIQKANRFHPLVKEYQTLIQRGSLRLRITHNDTKINNILFSSENGKAICAIDLDTLMPGYFIYDLGDMIRTFVSPVDEEEKDINKVSVRKEIYDALIAGYLSQMDEKLSTEEKKAIAFSGRMMTYIMALRMLTDFLNGDIYYHTTYPGQNLVRAENQFKLLEELAKS